MLAPDDVFVFPGPAPPELHPLSLHDALPISISTKPESVNLTALVAKFSSTRDSARSCPVRRSGTGCTRRSEEHTSELQSRFELVCRLLLEKKKVLRPNTRAHG